MAEEIRSLKDLKDRVRNIVAKGLEEDSKHPLTSLDLPLKSYKLDGEVTEIPCEKAELHCPRCNQSTVYFEGSFSNGMTIWLYVICHACKRRFRFEIFMD